jgi:hypothetical protein
MQHLNAAVVRPPRPADSVGGSPSKAAGDPAPRKSRVAARMRAEERADGKAWGVSAGAGCMGPVVAL